MKFLAALLFLIASSLLKAQSPVPGYRHFDTDDGLPSTEVYEILQDSKGYLWFGTDNGISRFNGYSFKNFGAINGLTDPVVFHLQEDRHGRIWMQCISGKLFYYENDSIYAFAGNKQLNTLLSGSPITSKGFYIDSKGHIYCSLLNLGLIRFSPSGDLTFIRKDLYSVSVYEIEKKPLSVFCFQNNQRDTALRIYQYWKEKQLLPVDLVADNTKSTLYLPIIEREGEPESFVLQNNALLFSVFDNFFCIRNGKVEWQEHFPYKILSWFQGSSKEIFIGLNAQKPLGVRRYDNEADIPVNKFTTLLEGYTVSHILEDREGGFWFATTEDGVFYQPNPRMRIYNRGSGLPEDKITSIAIKDDHHCFIGFEGAGIVQMDMHRGVPEPLPPAGGRVFDLAYDTQEDIPWAATADVQYLRQGHWYKMMDQVQSESQKRPIPMYSKHFHYYPDDGHLWSTNHFSFFNINTATKKLETYSLQAKLNGQVYASRTFDVLTSRTGHTWIANMNGLFEFKNNELQQAPAIHPALHTRIEALAELPDSTLVIGSKGYGLIFWKGNRVVALNENDGLTSNMVNNLLVDARGRLWAGTSNGLNRIAWKWGQTPDIRTITKAQGLPDNSISDVEVRGDYIWVATHAGLAYFADESPVRTLAPAPMIEKILVNDRKRIPGQPLNLADYQNNLFVQFASLQFRNAGKIRYRYRLEEKEEWRYTMEHQLNFAALAPGSYRFEVAAQNAEKQWSEPAILPFVIHPPWYETWWFWVIVVATTLGAIYLFYRYRLDMVKTKMATERHLSELERKALQAQMSPHFIFNCLNSLQLLILQNERDKALHYLGIFAKLVRGVLNASISGMVTLEEEINLLKHYLAMEKLRFKERFDFKISAAPGMDKLSRTLPPMLIQPFVENAVLHGMKGKSSGGEVEITFENKEDILIAVITDNGPGIQETDSLLSDVDKGIYKSVGMMLTRKRLELLNGAKQEGQVQTEILKNEAGDTIGTRITVFIKTDRGQFSKKDTSASG